MGSWSAIMWSALIWNCVVATWLFVSIEAITVSIDRSDNKPSPTRSSMIANGWRPLASGYEETIGTNVSPASNIERHAPALHPVLSKFQEHMATSEKLKPQRKSKPPPVHHDYNPPSILGSFTVFGHAATKARDEVQAHNHVGKYIPSETREYTFLIPPPKDAYRFELDHHRKPILRDSSAFLRQPQYISQNVHQPPDPIRAATYFIKGYTSTTNSPSQSTIPAKNRHYQNGFPVPQMLQPPRHQIKPFESLKVNSNVKSYFQPPGTAGPPDFGKDKRINEHDHRNFDRFQPQHSGQILNPVNTGNFYSQVNHPAHSYKTSFERDPAFLVHESHEVSFVTPASTYNAFNFRPSLPYETLLPPDVYSSSTPTPTTVLPRAQNANKYSQSNDVIREQDYKRPGPSGAIKQPDNGLQGEVLPTSGITNTYYVSEHQDLTPPPSAWPVQKTKYASDINEVLPRVNPPTKFNQEVINTNQIPQIPKIVYVRPQQQHYQSSIVPIDIRPQTADTEYETPESISLKHFNEQQFLIQQQLLQRDRQRLAEQERQQQLEIERQQQEELKKRQEELQQLIQQQKEEEEARLAIESAKNQSEQLAKVSDEQPPYTIQLADYEIPKVTTEPTLVITEQSTFGEQPRIQQPQVYQTEAALVTDAPEDQNYQYQEQTYNQPEEEQVNHQESEAEQQPHRPHKPSRDQYRRRKPTTIAYDPTPTEAPVQPPETSVPLTLHIEEIPVQTTAAPEAATLPTVTTQRPRSRRPGGPGRRRRPTTTTQETITESAADEYLKHDRPAEVHSQFEVGRRRRIKPTQATYDDTVTEKRPNIRKRPGHRNRVNPGEPFEAEIVTEIVHTPVSTYKEAGESVQRYNENNQFPTHNPENQYYDYTSQRFAPKDDQREGTTEVTQLEYFTEITRTRAEDYSTTEDHNRQQNGNVATSIPLEGLFIKTEGNYFDRATPVSSTNPTPSTTTFETTSATQSTTPVPQVATSTTRSHKIRPLRYGNTTRPRFSIKDYKSRLDYKSRVAQLSSTESSVTTAPHTKQRTTTAKYSAHNHQQNGDSTREVGGRYKHMSRMNYRTTTSAPTSKSQEQPQEEGTSSTTEKSSRFVPRRRPVSANVYRSRISGSKHRVQQHHETEAQPKPSTARPENIFSSVRRRPVMKSRLSAQKETGGAVHVEKKEEEATEMAAEETSFYSSMTTMPSTPLLTNDIPIEKGEPGPASVPVKSGTEEDKRGENSETGPSFQSNNENTATEPVPVSSTFGATEENQVAKARVEEQAVPIKLEEKGTVDQKEAEAEATTKFNVHSDEEELLARASQSVADLTSSASALYDKPGMFKAVSPESRVIAPHFKITTDEPTLPIEAFFQELSKKN